MKRLISLVAGLLILCSSMVYAQSRSISGTVVDAQDKPFAGVSVYVKGTTVGTITDARGEFTIEVPAGSDILGFSFIGMKDIEVPAQNGMKVKMGEGGVDLDPVINVGYSSTTTKAFAGSADILSAADIEKKNPSDITKSLAGEFAGVQVITTSGQPGTSSTIRVRGIGSVNSSTTPLYVVDGVPFNGDINAIDPGDIASTTILKDATATSLYGSRGANGVVLITTKKGTAGGEGKIDVDVKYGANMRLTPMHSVVTSPETYTELGWQGIVQYLMIESGMTEAAAKNQASGYLFRPAGSSVIGAYDNYNLWRGRSQDLINPSTGLFNTSIPRKYTPESWADEIFNVGNKVEANVKFHGGSDKTTYYTSFGYLKDEGYFLKSNFQRLTARSNVDFEPKKWLKGNVNLAYAYSELNNPGQDSDALNNGFLFVSAMPAIYPVFERDANGDKIVDPKVGGYRYDYGIGNGWSRGYGSNINPAGALQLDQQVFRAHNITGSAQFTIQFYKDLKFVSTTGMQYVGQDASSLTNPYYGDAEGIGRIDKQLDTYLSLTGTQGLYYEKTIQSVHNLDAFVAHEATFYTQSQVYGGKSQLYRPDGLEFGNAAKMSALTSSTAGYAIESYFGQIRYNYDERYFIHGTVRADGSSRFAPGKRWGTFGSVGAAWLISKEDFMSGTKSWLKDLKLKASFGTNGNQDVANYLYTDRYALSVLAENNALIWSALGNPNLTWEKSTIFNTGIEFTIDKYLTGSIEYFYKKTHDMLFPRQVAGSLGYTSYQVNDGELMNAGVELDLKAHIINKQNIKLDFRLNAARYNNKMLKMPLDALGQEMIVNGSASIGHSLYDWYMREYAGVDPATGDALFVTYIDKNNEFRVDPATGQTVTNYIASVHEYAITHPDAHIVKGTTKEISESGSNYIGKSALPGLMGGFGFDFTAYGVDFAATFVYQIGGYGYDNVYAAAMHSDQFGSYTWHTDIEKAWKQPGDVTDVPRLVNGSVNYANFGSSRFLTSNSFLQLSNVRIGYTLPKKSVEKLKLNNLNIWVSGNNLFALTARKGYAPYAALDGSSSTTQYAPLSTLMCGIKFQF